MAKSKKKIEKSILPDIPKGKVFIQTDKGVFPYEVLKSAEIEVNDTNSKQLKQKQTWMASNQLVPPPYRPEVLLNLYESNSILYRCVNQLAIDVAGLGWNITLKEGKSESKTELARINEFLTKPNEEEALRTILNKLLIDWGSMGWFGLEIVKNKKGEVAEIYQVPAQTLRVHISNRKYVQVRGQKKVWFKKFGSKKDIAWKDGKDKGKEGKGLSFRTKANEMIFFKKYYPKSDYYGVPNSIAATGDIMAMIGLRDYNLAFFENYGVPSAIIVLEGEWEEGSDKTVTEFLNANLKGAENGHKSLVITQPDNCKFHYTPLGKEVKEASFKLYEQTRREHILISFSMPPERIGVRIVGKLGGNVAEEANKIYVQSVVKPLQLDLSDIMNKLIGSDVYTFQFNEIDTRDHDAEVERTNKQIQNGTLTPNEARVELGLPAYSGGDKFYMGTSFVEVGEPDEPLGEPELEEESGEEENE